MPLFVLNEMERRHKRAFRYSILGKTNLETVVLSGGDIKHYFLELLLLVVTSGGGFGGVGTGVGVLGIPCT